MVEHLISLPKPFSSRDAKDWFQRFKICTTASGWKEEDQAINLPTLLEEAQAIWLELMAEQQKDHSVTKTDIQKAHGIRIARRILPQEAEAWQTNPCICS